MVGLHRSTRFNIPVVFSVTILIFISQVVLFSIAPILFPQYLIYVGLGFLFFFVSSRIEFEILSVFYKQAYVISIALLILPLLIGEITRGTIRWIPLGPITIQPSELVRPFLLLFFAKYLTEKRLTFQRFVKTSVLVLVPFTLIFVQPSLGVSILTLIGFVGVLLSSSVKRNYIVMAIVLTSVFGVVLFSALAPYQKQRIQSFINPEVDPQGAGYNSIQSMISIGSGGFFGRGLGRGIQTQLSFLPERHSDFIFASISEELGMVGSLFIISGLFFLLGSLVKIIDNARSPSARAFVSGLLFVLFFQTVINIGMNMGLLPVTGIPLPLVSAGGSSLLATLFSLGLATRSEKDRMITLS